MKSILVSGVLLLLMTSPSFAQQNVPDVQQDPPAERDGAAGRGTTQNQDSSLWWWLLPLLALPILYFLMKPSNDKVRTDGYDKRMVGTKGGRRKGKDEFIE